MGRGLGLAAVAGDLPTAAVAVAALVTQLGDLWLVFVLLGSLYWLGDAAPLPVDRRRAVALVGLTLVALGLVTGLKAAFALPRPPGAGTVTTDGVPAALAPLVEDAATADGFGFPSGHALGSTVVYGGLALAVESWPRRRRLLGGGAVVALVALSRVALGVHHLVDVFAGVAVGLAVLGSVVRYDLLDRPGVAFWLAVAAGLFAVAAGGYATDPLAVFGATVGARLSWGVVGDAVLAGSPTRRSTAVAATVGLPVFGGIFVASLALGVAPWVGFCLNGVVLAGVLALPLAVE